LSKRRADDAPIVEAVLFDMGGVLVELGPLDELLGSAMEGADFWPRWLASPSVRALESGRASVDEFARGLVDELELTIDPAEVVERFAAFPRGLYPGAVELVASVPDGVATGVLSNTNALHWEHQTDGETIRGLCHHAFLSYRMGVVKPDRAIFDRVAAALGLAGRRILFVDDNRINVDGARAAGLRAEVARGPAEAAAVLARFGLGTGPRSGPGR
jgi:putative hydrolase of the HAD superfamily